jgi:transcription initiation factor TFIIIB Brf1 subunit/transcription initiation factor TFIIB
LLSFLFSKIDKEEKHTRQGYKTKQKRKAFALLEEIGGNLNIHRVVVEHAKENFAKYRDIKEAVHKFEGTVAACLVIAYEDLSKEMSFEDVRSFLLYLLSFL